MNKDEQKKYLENLKNILPPQYSLFLDHLNNYEERKIGKDNINGLTVSTCFTPDMGYETAILDKYNAYPVERYKDKDDASIGHYEWCKKAETIEYIDVLGWIHDEGKKYHIKLERYNNIS
jgi:hypothetical protein